MAKNLMPEIIKALGLEYGEVFRVSEQDAETAEDGLFCFDKEGGLIKLNPDGSTCTAWEILYDILNGWCEIVKIPWEPKNCDDYYVLNVTTGRIECYSWGATTFDLAVKAMGIIYRTEAEAKTHMAEDYERLTGRKLEEKKIPWEPQRGESYYATSIVNPAQPKIACYDWNGSAADYACLKEGLVHKTQAEAEEHFAEDYQRLTGKELKG